MLVAVTAASGQLGHKVINRLRQMMPSSDIVAVVRNSARAADLGVTARTADYNDPNALRSAFNGIERLLIISSSSDFGMRTVEHANVVHAAKQAGVKHLAYTSLLHADNWNLPIAEDHKATEDLIRSIGIPFAILRNGWYWDNHTRAAVAALRHGILLDSVGDARISWASRTDLADAAAVALLAPRLADQTYELAGDQSYTLTDLVDEVARQSGKPLRYRDVSESELAAFFQGVGMPAGFASMLAETNAKGLRSGLLRDDSATLSKLIGRPTTTLESAVADALQPS
ncbi:NAD(P)H-binding protein [Rhizobium tropici]|uniref:SDR family NAD(P)-dependent oxidoreductase n=1 Tax=Rhizobium tropici TaxID=398 RepID=A0A329Y7A0_RHITR|nr:NAD(P)H-binding protein [Rhizobium tropici]RAX37914.1 SDR family NAD(P)-dependent oxidoreductase [Rhizobium tropici]